MDRFVVGAIKLIKRLNDENKEYENCKHTDPHWQEVLPLGQSGSFSFERARVAPHGVTSQSVS